jgi:hypothetical protein
VGKSPGADRLAEMGDGLRVAEKVLEAHGSSLEHLWLRVGGIPRFASFNLAASFRPAGESLH